MVCSYEQGFEERLDEKMQRLAKNKHENCWSLKCWKYLTHRHTEPICRLIAHTEQVFVEDKAHFAYYLFGFVYVLWAVVGIVGAHSNPFLGSCAGNHVHVDGPV